MQTFETFTDQRSGNAAVASETRAHRGVLVGNDFAALDVVELVDSSALTDPTLLAVCGCNPDCVFLPLWFMRSDHLVSRSSMSL